MHHKDALRLVESLREWPPTSTTSDKPRGAKEPMLYRDTRSSLHVTAPKFYLDASNNTDYQFAVRFGLPEYGDLDPLQVSQGAVGARKTIYWL